MQTSFVFKKPKGKALILLLLENFPRKDLINLIIAPPLVPLVEF
jgi:hypothetical protein